MNTYIKQKVLHIKDYSSVEKCFRDVTSLQKDYNLVHVLFDKIHYTKYFPEHLYGYYDDAGSWIEVDERDWEDVEEEIEHRVEHPIQETLKWDLSRVIIFYHGDMTKQQYIQWQRNIN